MIRTPKEPVQMDARLPCQSNAKATKSAEVPVELLAVEIFDVESDIRD